MKHKEISDKISMKKLLIITSWVSFYLVAATNSAFIKEINTAPSEKVLEKRHWQNSKFVEVIANKPSEQIELQPKKEINIKEFGYDSYVILSDGKIISHILQTVFVGVKGKNQIFEVFKDGTISRIIIRKSPVTGTAVPFAEVEKRLTPELKK